MAVVISAVELISSSWVEPVSCLNKYCVRTLLLFQRWTFLNSVSQKEHLQLLGVSDVDSFKPCVCVTANRLPVSLSCMTHGFVYLIVTCTGDWTLWLMMTLIWHTRCVCLTAVTVLVLSLYANNSADKSALLGQIRSDLQGNIVFIPTALRVNVSPSEWWMMCVMGPGIKKNATILGLSCCFCHFCLILRCLFMHVPIIFSVYKFESK